MLQDLTSVFQQSARINIPYQLYKNFYCRQKPFIQNLMVICMVISITNSSDKSMKKYN